MLSRLSRRLSYANVMSTIAVVVAVGTGSAYAANTIGTNDIIDNQVATWDVRDDTLGFGGLIAQDLAAGSVGTSEVANGSLFGTDISDGEIKNADLGIDVITALEVVNHSLRADDVGENTFEDFGVNIGVVPANGCVIKDVTGTAAAGDHILLTTSSADGLGAISYDAIEEPSSDGRFAIKACNPTTGALNDGTTHFNALVFAH
jgi:hypothetical protein